MLIHAVLALNWTNYLLKESIKGMLSILQIGFSKVKLNCLPFQLITKLCLTCFKNGQKKVHMGAGGREVGKMTLGERFSPDPSSDR